MLMKKILLVSGLVLSISTLNTAYAIEPVSTGVAVVTAIEAAEVATAATMGIVGIGVTTAITGTGIGILGGAGTAVVMNRHLFSSDEKRCQTHPKACEKAKVGTWTGAGLGTVGVVGTVAVISATSATGLATIGVAGAAALVATPILAAVAIGGGTYWWFVALQGNPQPQAYQCTFPDTPDAPAPNWICNPSMANSDFAAVGTGTSSSIFLRKQECLATARLAIAQQIQISIKNMFQSKGIADPEMVNVMLNNTSITLKGTRLVNSATSPTGTMYCLMTMDTSVIKETAKQATGTQQVLWQKFQTRMSINQLITDLKESEHQGDSQ